MADRAGRKARQRQKREKKRQALRRAASVSPYKRAAAGALVACRVNADWRERGQATVYILRRPAGPGAGLAMATFLVDLWCAGLKDAWGRFDMLRDEFDDIVERMGERMDARMADMPLEQAAAIVAGGIRFAVQNGFRLPPHLQRWTAFLGDKLDWQHADLSAFGVEGGTKLRWVGPFEDLRSRLIGSTVEQFITRPDVEFIGDVGGGFAPANSDDEWDEGYEDEEYDDDDDGGDDDFAASESEFRRPRLEDAEVISATDGPVVERPAPRALETLAGTGASLVGPARGSETQSEGSSESDGGYEQLASMAQSVIAAVNAWCFNEGLVPSRKLGKAAVFMLASGAMTDNSSSEEQIELLLDGLMRTVPDDEVDDVETGLQQIKRFVSTYRSPAAMMAVLEAGSRRVAGALQQSGPEPGRPAGPVPAEPNSQPAAPSETATPPG